MIIKSVIGSFYLPLLFTLVINFLIKLTTCEKIDNSLKNKEIIFKKIIPDLSVINVNDKKYESLESFFMAWDTLNDGEFTIDKDMPFTIIIPKKELVKQYYETERLKDFILEHLIPGEAFVTFNAEDIYGNSNGHKIFFKQLDTNNESLWALNDMKILRTSVLNEKLSVIYIDGILIDRQDFRINIENKYNEPQRLFMRNNNSSTAKDDQNIQELKETKTNRTNDLIKFLSEMRIGVKVFLHFLTKSNLTKQLNDSPFTILIPMDTAFQRWHPIDWGFYPFSVQEFTENILRNHLLQMKKPIRMSDVMHMDRGHKYKTFGGEIVVFKNYPTPSVNNVSIVANHTLNDGNVIFIISEVLFVTEAVVSRLHQMHKDKETPPLLAFPWFGAQFLSHSFLALERDSRFTIITRFLNMIDIAHYVSGANYTFFVPVDDAFIKLGFYAIDDNDLSLDKLSRMITNHFVKGRLYDRDLKHDRIFEAIGGGSLKIQRKLPGNNVTVNQAQIIETEVFVYNLGTMFYIDDVLYSDIFKDELPPPTKLSSTTQQTIKHNKYSNKNINNYKYSTIPEAESIPNTEYTEQNDSIDEDNDEDADDEDDIDVIENNNKKTNNNEESNNNQDVNDDDDDDDDDYVHDEDEIVTPRALPLHYNLRSPRK